MMIFLYSSFLKGEEAKITMTLGKLSAEGPHSATGKIKRSQTNKRHLLNSNAKTSKRKARLRKATLVDKTMAANVKRMLPYGN